MSVCLSTRGVPSVVVRTSVILGGMTLAVPGSTGFVALAQRAVIGMCARRPRRTSPERGYTDVRTFHRAPTGPEFAEGGLT